MKTSQHDLIRHRNSSGNGGSVLVIVIWIIFGLIAITLYFGNSMVYELRATDNRIAGIEAEEAIEAGRRYVSLVLSNLNQAGAVPDPQSFQCAAVPVGNAKFWLIGRTNVDISTTTPTTVAFGLVDEASKLNLNSSFVGTNLMLLEPNMTVDVAYNIVAWRSTNTSNANGGAESDTYSGLPTPYLAKNAKFETVDELRMIYGVDIDLLYGEDANLNGCMEPNENDGDATAPSDNQDGRLDPGLFEYTTVYTHIPMTQTNGQPRIATTNSNGLMAFMESNINLTINIPQGGYGSPLQFYIAASTLRGMSQAQFMQIESSIVGTNTVGLVNVNTASAAVLQCLPGMDISKATQITAYRQSNQSNPNNINTMAWLTQVGLDSNTLQSIAPWVTGQTYQFTADIAAVGHNGRGYRRTRFVFDISSGTPKIVYRQDLSNLGWALGKPVRDDLLAAK